jgi:ribosome biogenesis GTPase
VELWATGKDVESNFEDIEALALECKFSNCRHQTEPACAVRAAVAHGDLEAGRLASYVKLARPSQLGGKARAQ